MSAIIQLSGTKVQIDPAQIAKLKIMAAASPLLRSRTLAHPNAQSSVHEMLIVLHRDSVVAPHRHPPEKAESYLLLDGALRVSTWQSPTAPREDQDLAPFGVGSALPFFWRHANGLWHQPVSLDEWAVYLEVYQGPFDKDVDVEYMP